MAGEVVSFEFTGANGESLAKLGEVIAWRANALKTSTRESTIATTITALKSLRRLTRVNRGAMKPVSEKLDDLLSVSLERVSNYSVSFSAKLGKWCIRDGAGNRVDISPWWQVVPRDGLRAEAKVYRIRLSADRLEAWRHQKAEGYLVATDDASAKAIVEKRFGKIVKRYGSLAQSTLGRVMAKVSDRSVALDIGRNGMKVVIANAKVRKNLEGWSDGVFGIEVEDSLRFATDALEGGAGAVESAVQSAANSVVGFINKQIDEDKHHFFSSREIGKMATPFPREAVSP